VANQCQVFAEVASSSELQTVRLRLREFVRALPAAAGTAEALVLRCLLLELYLQIESLALRVGERVPYRGRAQRWWSGDRRVEVTARSFQNACEAVLDSFGDGSPLPLHVRAQRFLDGHWRDDISLPAVARTLHVHPRTLRRHFRQAFGTSIRAYRIRLRANRGVELLKQTELKIEAIAAMVGCHDRSAFCHLIERATGMRPSELRRAAKAGAAISPVRARAALAGSVAEAARD
jgi:AraC-like DNA-binding protein